MKQRIILAGGRGFLGQLLSDWFRQRGWAVVVLTRTPAQGMDGIRQVEWDGASLGEWTQELEGAVTNQELMAAVRELSGVPLGLPATRWMLELGALLLRTETELILKSRRVVPGRLVESGFTFHYPDLRGALRTFAGVRP